MILVRRTNKRTGQKATVSWEVAWSCLKSSYYVEFYARQALLEQRTLQTLSTSWQLYAAEEEDWFHAPPVDVAPHLVDMAKDALKSTNEKED
jgi:hypothetical protein